MFKDECWGAGDRVFDDAVQGYHVCAASQVFQNLYFPLDFLLFDWLQCFDDALVVCINVYALEHFAVLPSSKLSH